jgi:hypothetical protein
LVPRSLKSRRSRSELATAGERRRPGHVDPQEVEPAALKDDDDRYEKNPDPALAEKARRRGNYGWRVGRSIQVSPHVRAACPAALCWTGEGRKIPKIRFHRGSIVHRTKIAEMPTGFLEEPHGTFEGQDDP